MQSVSGQGGILLGVGGASGTEEGSKRGLGRRMGTGQKARWLSAPGTLRRQRGPC